MRVAFLVLLGSFLLIPVAGCQELQTTPPALPAEAQRVLDDIGRLNYHDPARVNGTFSEAELKTIRRRRGAFYNELLIAVIHSVDFEQAKRRVDAVLEDEAYGSDIVARQMAAAALLKGHVIPERSALRPEDEDALAAVTSSFIEDRNPEVTTLLRAVHALERQGFGTLSRATAEASMEYIEQNQSHLVGCADCVSELPIGKIGPEGTQSVETAIRELQALAERPDATE